MAEQMHRSKVQLLDQRRNVIGMLLKGKVVAGARGRCRSQADLWPAPVPR
jgi:hypothetical protein